MTMQQYFHETVEKYKEKIAFNYYGNDEKWQALTYLDLYELVQGMASKLRHMKVVKGDKVAICAENHPHWCAAYLAIIMRGAICVPIDSELGIQEIENIVKSAGAKIIFMSTSIAPKLETLSVQTISLPFTLEKKHCPVYEVIELEETDIASIIYTSGTTGTPKGVVLTHRNFCSDAEAVIETGLLKSTDRVLSILPLHHTYPFMCTFVVPIVFGGGTVTYPKSLKSPDLVDAIKTKGVTVLIGVPRVLEMLLNGIEKKLETLPKPVYPMINGIRALSGKLKTATGGFNLGYAIFQNTIHSAFGTQFRFMASGGAKLNPTVMMKLEALGFTVIEGYGLTETSPVLTFNRENKRKAGSCGKPLNGVDIKIAAEGEIIVKGPMVMSGYYNMPEETEKVLKDGWFYTGDVGHIDKDGYLYITGRLKEVIVLSSGKNVYPEDLEKKYAAIPLIEDICIYGSGDAKITLQALIVPNFDYAKQMKIANIHEALKWDIYEVSQTLPSYMRIQGFTLTKEALPKTRLGKIQRFRIHKKIAAELAAEKPTKTQKDLNGENASNGILLKVKDTLKTIGDIEREIYSTDNIEIDLGFDSLKRIEMLSALEESFKLKLPETFGLDIQTVGELATAIANHKDSAKASDYEKTTQTGFAEIISRPPSPKELQLSGIGNSGVKTIIKTLATPMLSAAFTRLFNGSVKGIENLPKTPYILCPNHVSYIDAPVVWAAMPQSIREILYFQGSREFFHNRSLGWFAKAANVILIDPDAYLKGALSISAHLLRQSKALCIFPEGGRSDGNIQTFKRGIGVLSYHCNVPLVPVYLKGTAETMPRGQVLPKLSDIVVLIGNPIVPQDVASTVSDVYQAIADKVRDEVLRLKMQ
ncbi:MAG: AMP-binding protein [Candidatus Magnetoovum sp. WYHC-5]|nr:AMP-binding protein [Candidatus Magnetoovum sp. WYHC-5]